MELSDRLDQLSAKLRMPPWGVALLAVILIDAVLAIGIVFAIKFGGVASPTNPKAWTLRELEDRFLLKSMDDIEPVLGRCDHASVDNAGNIASLRYESVTVVVKGKIVQRGVSIFGKGGRCTFIGFDTVDEPRTNRR